MSTPLPPDDPRHGTENGYSNLNCRCQPCRDAHAAETTYRRSLRTPPPAGDPRHGTDNCYRNFNCRCRECTDSHAAARRASYHATAARRATQGATA